MARKKVGSESKVISIAEVQGALRHIEWEVQMIRDAIAMIDTSDREKALQMAPESWDGETDPIMFDHCKARK